MEQVLSNKEVATVFALHWNGHYCIGINKHPISIGGDTLDAISKFGRTKATLLVTPMDRITDEHAIEAINCCGIVIFSENIKTRAAKAKSMLDDMINSHQSIEFETYQYLISKHYDVPLWFGINHWANGKTAIQLGIAIDSAPMIKEVF